MRTLIFHVGIIKKNLAQAMRCPDDQSPHRDKLFQT